MAINPSPKTRTEHRSARKSVNRICFSIDRVAVHIRADRTHSLFLDQFRSHRSQKRVGGSMRSSQTLWTLTPRPESIVARVQV